MLGRVAPMKALRSFTVRARLPEPLARLEDLAMNLRWSWDERTRELFRWVDPDEWERTGHDPVGLLGRVRRERLDVLANDPSFVAFLDEAYDNLQRYLESPQWFQRQEDSPLRAVAYFSPEFGIAEAVPQSPGGLGVLAGDHLKASSGLGVPLTGVGLMYRQGYFRQSLSDDGLQQEIYPRLDPHAMALELVDDVRVSVDLAGTPLHARVWRARVGRVTLYMLDSDVEENDGEGRAVTDRLYGGDSEHRIRQEILLGIGGVRALEALGVETQVFHTNEGHAGFLGLERIRRLIVDNGLSFDEAVEAARAGTVFTTHTPVPAGIDRFTRDVMERYFKSWADECNISFDQLMALGHEPDEDPSEPFNMAVMGLRLAGRSNGVSKLHGGVSRSMFKGLWPGVPEDEVPITSVTNGVHARTWVSPEMDDLLRRYVLPAWPEASPEAWARIDDARDDELWRVLDQGRERLVAFARKRMRSALRHRGMSDSETEWCEEILDPRILTIGFARRFATYKRATLLLSQPDRLRSLLLGDRPVQLVFAGKAHPADDLGKQMIKDIVQWSRQPDVRHRIVFLEDYDIEVARMMYQGSDVWLNTPRRPQEASGTSGEKAALNGALNCSILDGWWDEMFDGENGWAISSNESEPDLGKRDVAEASSLFDILERQVVPLFYDRSESIIPRRWVRRVKSSLQSLGPQVSAARMLKDYVQEMYEPAAARADAFTGDSHARAREVAAWRRRVTDGWNAVKVTSVEHDAGAADLGTDRTVRAQVELGGLTADDVTVQLVHGRVGQSDELVEPTVTAMTPDKKSGGYKGTFTCETAGRYGFTVRVVPHHAEVGNPIEAGLVTWA
jgi:starch phosphorylase